MSDTQPTEKSVKESIRSAGKLVLGPDLPNTDEKAEISRRIIKADWIAKALSEPASPNQPRFHSFEIEGAVIDGGLTLRYLSLSEAGQYASLTFKNCVFRGAIDLKHGRFGQFSLKGSRFSRLDAEGAVFHGEVDLSGVQSSQASAQETGCGDGKGSKRGLCTANFQAAEIFGALRAHDAILCCPPRDETCDVSTGGMHFALKLSRARIHGTLFLQPGFKAFGGISMNDSRIEGSVWLQGAELTAEWDTALNINQTKISGSLSLSVPQRGNKTIEPFRCTGGINLLSTEIQGGLYIEGAEIKCGKSPHAFRADHSKIAAALSISDWTDTNKKAPSIRTRIEGSFIARSCHIGQFFVAGSTFDNESLFSLDLSDSHIDNTLTITSSDFLVFKHGKHTFVSARSEFSGAFVADRVKVDGRVDIAHATIYGKGLFALHFDEAIIAGSFSLNSAICNGGVTLRSARIAGRLDVTRSEIIDGFRADDFDVAEPASFRNLHMAGGSGHLNLEGARFASSLSLDGLECKEITLRRATIDGHTSVSNIRLFGLTPGTHSVSMTGTKFQNGFSVGSKSNEASSRYSAFSFMHSLKKVRRIPLSFYPGWDLVECHFADTNQPDDVSDHFVASLLRNRKTDEFVILNGSSSTIHQFNQIDDSKRTKLNLNKRNVLSYLQFFCAYVWAEQGAFQTITGNTEITVLKEKLQKIDEKKEFAPSDINRVFESKDNKGAFWTTTSFVSYAGMRFASRFKVDKSGMVEMTEDLPLKSEDKQIESVKPSPNNTVEEPSVRYAAPYRVQQPGTELDTIAGTWTTLIVDKDIEKTLAAFGVKGWLPGASSLDQKNAKTSTKLCLDYRAILVDLTGAHARSLDDDVGASWGKDVQLKLSGFHYDHIDLDLSLKSIDKLDPNSQQSKTAAQSSAAPQRPEHDQKDSTQKFDLQKTHAAAKKGDSQSGSAGHSQDKATRNTTIKAPLRISWLRKQYSKCGKGKREKMPQHRIAFDHQPFAQLAAAYARSGDTADAHKITLERLKREGIFQMRAFQAEADGFVRDRDAMWRLLVPDSILAGVLWLFGLACIAFVGVAVTTHNPEYLLYALVFLAPQAMFQVTPFLFYWGFRLGFGFGLDPSRALATFAAFIVIGWICVEASNRGSFAGYSFANWPQVLIQVSETGAGNFQAAPSADQAGSRDQACGTSIVPLIYAADVFIPIIDLRQESLCTVSSQQSVPWAYLKSLYALFGWLVTSLMILTVSGVLRSRIGH